MAHAQELHGDEANLPAFKVDMSGLTCMTLEVPSVQSKDAWNSFLQLLSLADGIVILRIADDAEHDQDGYLAKSPMLAEVYEIIDCLQGPCAGFAHDIPSVVAASRGNRGCNVRFAKVQNDLHPITSIALKKRLMEKAVRRLQLVGDPIDANEAQRLGLVDFVGSEAAVENEICRLIYRNCSPASQYFMYKSDLVKAMREKEEN
eukprot:CAMPEP_0114687630 /NCGR_PEP_ID=MMETSP0191-20121206/62709_1 /TAXON_ID=126664 /ORGANISM="Sorites sp." /LENGTH=203 /DNA_ID=CAMNT_0001974383 /DNA_START=48 /DNA_END=660 /DNA_ORIENTATION=-